MNKDLIIQKQDEIIAVMQRHLDFSSIGDLRDVNLIESLESELSSLKSAKEEVKSAVNNIEIQEYTFDDYLKLEKETLVKLLMNCQKLLYGNQYATSNNHIESTVQSVKGEGERRKEIEDLMIVVWHGGQKSEHKGGECFEDSLKKNGSPIHPFNMTVKDVIDTIMQMISYKHSESKDMYPKEFIEFLCDYYQKFWDRYILLNGEHVDPFNTKQPFFTFEEVFNHWSTVVTKR